MGSHDRETEQLDTINKLYCTSCGRFLGFYIIVDGMVMILCKNCKGWTMVTEGSTTEALTKIENFDKVLMQGK